MRMIDRLNPAVPVSLLLFLAGAVWIMVGTMLVYLAYTWLSAAEGINRLFFIVPGILLGLMVHHFGFLKIVDKNLDRLLSMKGKHCLFAFFPWRSYLIVAVMITMGSILRHSDIPKQYLAILYTGIGLALALSSVRYLRVFWREIF
jgi:hypothetical protein